MQSLVPHEETRRRTAKVVAASLLIPGLGHLLCERRRWALFWFLLCQGLLITGFVLAGSTQLDFGRWFGFGGAKMLFVCLPEIGNIGGTQLVARMYHSIENGGLSPVVLPWRHLGYLLSGASGVLSCWAAAHAASAQMEKDEPLPTGRISPGNATLAALLFPGLGHWLSGRRFKAVFMGGTVFMMFVLGMALGDFSDLERARHPYYWGGQMLGGPMVWLTSLAVATRRFTEVLPFQDAGLLFTTTAGMFQAILALDVFHRSQHDWLEEARK